MKIILFVLLALSSALNVTLADDSQETCKLFKVRWTANERTNCRIIFGNKFERFSKIAHDWTPRGNWSFEQCEELARESLPQREAYFIFMGWEMTVATVKHIDPESCIKTTTKIYKY